MAQPDPYLTPAATQVQYSDAFKTSIIWKTGFLLRLLISIALAVPIVFVVSYFAGAIFGGWVGLVAFFMLGVMMFHAIINSQRKVLSESNVKDCSECGREVSENCRICPRCNYRF